MRWPDVFLVYGPSSAGKTTLCRALQAAVRDPYLVVGFDDFIFMSEPRYYRGADTPQQHERDRFTALGAEMVTISPPGTADRHCPVRPGLPAPGRFHGARGARPGRRRQPGDLRPCAA